MHIFVFSNAIFSRDRILACIELFSLLKLCMANGIMKLRRRADEDEFLNNIKIKHSSFTDQGRKSASCSTDFSKNLFFLT